MPFKVTQLSRVEAQINLLAKRAATLGTIKPFSTALRRALERMKSDPLVWGDPEYNLKHGDGIVCHGIAGPILVHFAVYEAEQVVCILDVEPLAGSSLANS